MCSQINEIKLKCKNIEYLFVIKKYFFKKGTFKFTLSLKKSKKNLALM